MIVSDTTKTNVQRQLEELSDGPATTAVKTAAAPVAHVDVNLFIVRELRAFNQRKDRRLLLTKQQTKRDPIQTDGER